MANETFLDAAGSTKYRKSTGAGSAGDPAVTHAIIDSGTITTVSTVTGVTTVSTVNSVTALGTITPGTAATSLGKAEDAAHSSGDVGVMGLAVRNDAGTTLAGTDGDYAPLSVNSAGALYVTGGGGGTEYTEDAAAAANPVGNAQILVRADTPGTVTTTDGDNVAQRGTNYGAAYVQLVTSSGSFIDSVGGGTQYAVDAALGSTPTSTLAVAIRDDALSALTPVEGDAIGLRVDANGALWVGVSGTVAATQSGTWNIGTVTTVSTVTNLSQLGGQAIAMGTGVRSAGTQRVTIATDDSVPVTGTFWQATQPVSGTVTANLAAGTNNIGDVDVLSIIPGTGATNLGKAIDTATGATDTGVLALATRDDALSALTPIEGDNVQLRTDANGALWVIPSGTITVASHAVTNAGTFVVQENGAALTALQLIDNAVSGAGFNITQFAGAAVPVGAGLEATAVRVTLPTDGTGVVRLGAGTAGIGKLTANSGVDIGDVDVTSAVISSGTLTTCSTVTTLSTLTGGGVAHDGADSGNPVKIGVKATASVLGATPVAAADRTDLFAGTDGVLIQRPHTSLEDIISERTTNTDGASTAMTGAFAATASQRIYLTSLILCNSSASNCTVDIRDGAAGSVLLTVPVPAGGGVVFNPPVPLRFSANTALAYDASAATTTLTITCLGFKSKN